LTPKVKRTHVPGICGQFPAFKKKILHARRLHHRNSSFFLNRNSSLFLNRGPFVIFPLGIIAVSNEHELLQAVANLSASDYSRRSQAIATNTARARL
jgi:hypothetical protein